MKPRHSDIVRSLGATYAQRGKRLWKNGHVREADWHDEGLRIEASALVVGSGGNPYRVKLSFSPLPTEGFLVVGQCDCPVGFGCKHVAAAGYHVVESLENAAGSAVTAKPNRKDPLNAWFETLHQTYEKKSTSSIEKTIYHLRYHLRPWGENLKIELRRHKRLKGGGWSSGAIVDLASFLHHPESYDFDYLTHLDVKIARYLAACLTKEWNVSFFPHLPTFGMALRLIAETGRGFVTQKNASIPLRWEDEPVDLTWQWKKSRSGVFSLKPSIDPSRIYGEYPLIHLDSKGVLRPVRTTMEIDEIARIKELPPIENEAALAGFVHRLAQEMPDPPFPLPETYLPIERIEIEPEPVLRIKKPFVAGLIARYGEAKLPADSKKRVEILDMEDRFVTIVRQSDKERAFEARLAAEGFDVKESVGRLAVTKPDEKIEAWRRFVEEALPALEAEGWHIDIDRKALPAFTHVETIEAIGEEERPGWFELSYHVEIDGEPVSLVEPVAALLQRYDSPDALPERLNLPIDERHYLHVATETIRPILRTLFQLFDRIEGDRLKVARFDAHLLDGFDDGRLRWKGPDELIDLRKKLAHFRGIEPLEPAPTLRANLRNYQRFGLSWLGFLHHYGFGGILADDMGLGKTLQTLALLQRLKHNGALNKPALIVVPTSLLGNWRLEAARFTPDLRLHTLYGSDRKTTYRTLEEADIVMTTYAIAQRDAALLSEREFALIALDEAQKIKNPRAKITLALKSLRAPFRLALTGTPIENHLGELWSIFDFLIPGFLGTHAFFKTYFQTPIEKEKSVEKSERLRRKIAPFMLRRTKEEVLDELPEKIEMVRSVAFGKKQAALYETIRLAMEKRVRDEIAKKGLARSQIMVLDALLKMRQVCCDPALLKIPEAKKVRESAKLDLLMELLAQLLPQGRKILLFSQFTEMLARIETRLKAEEIDYLKLTGRTRKRDEVIEAFNRDDGPPLFLISLKAGGVGLNLTAADTVIHYDPWWNPAVENQATDRAHRIGQTKRVEVYKLIVEGSVEEKILTLQQKKARLQRGLYDKRDSKEMLDADVLLALLQNP
ncbi:DEAD/DEAH box helicase [Hydrogenimonas sp.]